jgi:hypothetical protein
VSNISVYNSNYRIAISKAKLQNGYFFVWGIPAPEFCIFKNYSTEISMVDGGQSQHGFYSVELSWPKLSFSQVKIIRHFVELSLGSSGTGVLWLTVDLSTCGLYTRNTWADIYGKPNRPKLTPVANSANLLFEDYKLVLNNVAIENNPAQGL